MTMQGKTPNWLKQLRLLGKVLPSRHAHTLVPSRGPEEFDAREMMQHDIAYIQDWSLWLDLLILLRTLPAVLRGRGAR
jgi:hypothetical protein